MSTLDILLSFDGRISRSEFWVKGYLPLCLPGLLSVLLVHSNQGTLFAIGVSIGLLMVWPTLAIYVKRLHDHNRSGWILVLCVIPVIGSITLLYVIFKTWFIEGTICRNDYGDDPLEKTPQGHRMAFPSAKSLTSQQPIAAPEANPQFLKSITAVVILVAILLATGLGMFYSYSKYSAREQIAHNKSFEEQNQRYKDERSFDYVHSHLSNHSLSDGSAIDYVGGTVEYTSDTYSAKYVRYAYSSFKYFSPDQPKMITLYLTDNSYEDLRPKPDSSPILGLLPQEDHSDVEWERDFTVDQMQSFITALDKIPEWESISEKQQLEVSHKVFFKLLDADGKKLLLEVAFSDHTSTHTSDIALDFSPHNASDPEAAFPVGNVVSIDGEHIPCFEQMLQNALTEYNTKYDAALQAYNNSQQAFQKEQAIEQVNQAKADALLK